MGGREWREERENGKGGKAPIGGCNICIKRCGHLLEAVILYYDGKGGKRAGKAVILYYQVGGEGGKGGKGGKSGEEREAREGREERGRAERVRAPIGGFNIVLVNGGREGRQKQQGREERKGAGTYWRLLNGGGRAGRAGRAGSAG